jgi:hypothetical protein
MADLETRFTTLYLGYSSNLSPFTMKQRCQDSLFVGIALLKDCKWIINTTSYASIIPSPGDVVYSSLYFLSAVKKPHSMHLKGFPGRLISIEIYHSSICYFMAAVHGWIRWNGSRAIGGFLLKRLFMLSKYSKQYILSCFPNPSLSPSVLDNLVRLCINVGRINADR